MYIVYMCVSTYQDLHVQVNDQCVATVPDMRKHQLFVQIWVALCVMLKICTCTPRAIYRALVCACAPVDADRITCSVC